MIENIPPEIGSICVPLLDDAYLAWLSAESESERALHNWWRTAGVDSATAYAAYEAALDREQAAARDLQCRWTGSQTRRIAPALGAPGARD
ncbi:MAG: hypothetical protein WAL63_09570 [Solirubrobacteraceae bacterium]